MKKLFRPFMVNTKSFFCDSRYNDNVQFPYRGDPRKCFLGEYVAIEHVIGQKFKIAGFIQHLFDKNRNSRANHTGKSNYRIVLQSLNDTLSYYFAIVDADEECFDFKFLISEEILQKREFLKKAIEERRIKEKLIQDSINNSELQLHREQNKILKLKEIEKEKELEILNARKK